MIRAEREATYEFVMWAARDCGMERQDIFDLLTLAHSLHSMYELACETELSKRQEKREEKAENKVDEIAKKYKLTYERQGDPRGWPIILKYEVEMSFYSGGGAPQISSWTREVRVPPYGV